jgi:hypothetical protein
MTIRHTLALAALVAIGLPAAPERASAQATPVAAVKDETTVLTLSGKLGRSATIDLTMADLRKLPQAEIRTTTPWHDGTQVFVGVPLAALLEHVGAAGQNLQVTALNKYQTIIPVEDAKRKPILAYLRNGAPMAVRDKGPLFIIYPYDSDPALKSELYFGRSAWQVRSIAVD